MTFPECVAECASTPELISQFNRLTGRNLGQSLSRTAIERLVDEAAGYSGENQDDLAAFTAFVLWVVWLPLTSKEGEVTP